MPFSLDYYFAIKWMVFLFFCAHSKSSNLFWELCDGEECTSHDCNDFLSLDFVSVGKDSDEIDRAVSAEFESA